MSIANYKPEARLPSVTNRPKIQSDFYKGTLVDDSELPISTLLGYIEGSPWNAEEYFSRVISENNDLKTVDVNISSVFQQYEKIIDLEIRVSQALSDSYDQATSVSIVNGNGFIYNVIIPNKNDYFTATIGANKKALLRITSVERKTFNDESVFYIEYDIVGYVDDDKQAGLLYKKLLESSIRTYYYSKERMVKGLSPLLREEYHNKELNLLHILKSMVKEYFAMFYNTRHGTIIIPGQESPVYDKYVIDFLIKITDSDEAPEIRKCKLHATDGDVFLSQKNIWDLLIHRESLKMQTINEVMCYTSKQLFLRNSYSRSLAFNSISYYVYPFITNDSLYTVNTEVKKYADTTFTLSDTFNRNMQSFKYNDSIYKDDILNVMIVKPLTSYNNYVLSGDFYNSGHNLSLLEIMVSDYLNNKPINMKYLYSLIEVYKDWNRLEQFYFIPIVIIFIKMARLGFYE